MVCDRTQQRERTAWPRALELGHGECERSGSEGEAEREEWGVRGARPVLEHERRGSWHGRGTTGARAWAAMGTPVHDGGRQST